MSASLKTYIEVLIAGERHLTAAETEAAFSEILKGADEVQVGSLLTLYAHVAKLQPKLPAWYGL